MTKTVVLTANSAWYLYNFRKSTIIALKEKGYKVVCLAPEDSYRASLESLGVEFVAIGLEGKSIGVFSELFSLINVFLVLRKLQPSFVYNFTIKLNIYSGFSCKVLGIPYANNVSGLGTVFLHKGLRFKIARLFYGMSNRGAARVFFQNSEDLKTFVELDLSSEEKAQLIPGSGVDLDRFAFKSMPDLNPLSFIMIARLIEDKGVREYVAAAEIIRQEFPNTQFYLIGPDKVSNKTAISQVTIVQWKEEGNIDYVGPQDDVVPWLNKSHVFVLPSYREGMPRTVLEAASIGRPSIVSNVPGCRQAIIENQTGWFCEARDAESLARTMRAVINLGEKALSEAGQKAREHMSKNFSETLVVGAYLALLGKG